MWGASGTCRRNRSPRICLRRKGRQSFCSESVTLLRSVVAGRCETGLRIPLLLFLDLSLAPILTFPRERGKGQRILRSRRPPLSAMDQLKARTPVFVPIPSPVPRGRDQDIRIRAISSSLPLLRGGRLGWGRFRLITHRGTSTCVVTLNDRSRWQ